MKVLITGSKGFVGTRLTEFLKSRGYYVVGCNEQITNKGDLEPYFENVDFVVHLVTKRSSYGSPGRENDTFYEINVGGTQNVIDLCLKYNCKLIYFSSISAENQKTEYGKSKAEAELIIKRSVINHSLKAMTIRPCGIYNAKHQDSQSNTVSTFRTINYPLEQLIKDVERIIRTHNFNEYKVFKTTLFRHRVYRLLKKIRKLL